MEYQLNKAVFTTADVDFIVGRLDQAVEKGFLEIRTENNPHMMASYRGIDEEKGISPKWNIKIYKYNVEKKGHSIVCSNMHILDSLLKEDYDSFAPKDGLPLYIDDAGWGFPLCGVMVGVATPFAFKTAIIPVQNFRDQHFREKRYLREYTSLGLELVEQFCASPIINRIEICPGYVNEPLRDKLRSHGYDVHVGEIKGMFQEELEEEFRRYVVNEIGVDIYYDPKKLKSWEITERYKECVEFGRKNCPDKMKTGWNSIGPR